jgi:fluoride exporter
MLVSSLLIALGGALGSVARFWVAEAISTYFTTDFPWGTIIANVSGCFAIGVIAALTSDGRTIAALQTREFLMIGVLGGYTTFSSFSLQTLLLAQNGEWLRAGANVGLSVAACLVAVWFGHAIVTAAASAT